MKVTRRQLRRLVNEVFIKPDPMRRWGPLNLPPYQPGMPISKGEYDALAVLYKTEPEMALSMANAMGLIPTSPPLTTGVPGQSLTDMFDTAALSDDPDKDEIKQWMRDTHISGRYDPADYSILGDDYVEQIRNYHKDPRSHLGVPINEVMTRGQLRRLIREVYTPGSPMDVWSRTGIDPSDARALRGLSKRDIVQARALEDASGYPLGSTTVMSELEPYRDMRDRFHAVMDTRDYNKLLGDIMSLSNQHPDRKSELGRLIQHHSVNIWDDNALIFDGDLFRKWFGQGSKTSALTSEAANDAIAIYGFEERYPNSGVSKQ